MLNLRMRFGVASLTADWWFARCRGQMGRKSCPNTDDHKLNHLHKDINNQVSQGAPNVTFKIRSKQGCKHSRSESWVFPNSRCWTDELWGSAVLFQSNVKDNWAKWLSVVVKTLVFLTPGLCFTEILRPLSDFHFPLNLIYKWSRR